MDTQQIVQDSQVQNIAIDGDSLSIADLFAVAASWHEPARVTVSLTSDARERVRRSRRVVEELLESGTVVYGVTTGFGNFRDRLIPPSQVAQLQRNLIVSHSVGVGAPLDSATVRALMLVRINSLVKGYSGIRLEVVERLVEMINRGVYPVIPCKGSVGASGDLAPLAHMVLVLIGEGEATVNGIQMAGADALRSVGLEPVSLQAKEGVALINGTSVMAAIGAQVIVRARVLSRMADIAGAMSLEALNGTRDAFDERIHAARPHPEQVNSAAYLRRLLEGSQLTRSFDPLRVQDAYSLRCMPQVHGAVRTAIEYAAGVLALELNAAVDNPLLFRDDDGKPFALSGGNFHGEPIALVMDHLANAVAELGNISERRIARLIDPALNEGLPAFLVDQGGLNSGFMLPQYTAAALASENKVLAHPASVDSIPTSANTEDHVSMGTTAARQTAEIVENVATILAIELICAAQAIDFRLREGAQSLGTGTYAAHRAIRQIVPFIQSDTAMYPYINAVQAIVLNGDLLNTVEAALAADPAYELHM